MVGDWILRRVGVFPGVLAFRENSPLIDPEKLKHLRENVDWVLAGQPHNWFTEMAETIEGLWKENAELKDTIKNKMISLEDYRYESDRLQDWLFVYSERINELKQKLEAVLKAAKDQPVRTRELNKALDDLEAK